MSNYTTAWDETLPPGSETMTIKGGNVGIQVAAPGNI